MNRKLATLVGMLSAELQLWSNRCRSTVGLLFLDAYVRKALTSGFLKFSTILQFAECESVRIRMTIPEGEKINVPISSQRLGSRAASSVQSECCR